MDDERIVAFVPVLNGGVNKLADYEFATGVKLTASVPPDSLRLALESLASNQWVSLAESRALELARGMLWIESREAPLRPQETISGTSRIATKLRNVLWCIYLHPFGENTYWRFSNLLSNCAVYVHSHLGGFFDSPRRFPFMYGVPNGEQGTVAGWPVDVLRSADALAAALESYQERIPRVYLAGKLHRIMAGVEVMEFSAVRLQLAVTALETFYIAPRESKHIWTPDVVTRVRNLCPDSIDIPPGFFTDLQQVRNDVVHRGGLSKQGDVNHRRASVLITVELILRETLKWAIRNLREVGDAFEKDEWPEPA